MRILLTGANGQVGWELRRTLLTLGEVVVVGRDDMDIARPESISSALARVRPDVIVNAAAYTVVDKAESEPDLAMAINGVAPGVMAEEAERAGALLVHYSTDYVFDGRKSGPYAEEDAANPLNAYGRTKLAGENAIRAAGGAHLIFRTSWVYGARGKNFLLSMRRLAAERDELRIVGDQIGAPTWSRSIAEATAQVLVRVAAPGAGYTRESLGDMSGTYHLTAAGSTSWYEFARAILQTAPPRNKKAPVLVPISAAEYQSPAARPKNSVLSNAKFARTFDLGLPDWRAQLSLCLEDIDRP